MYHFLASSFRNSLITSKRSVSFHLLASAFIIRFFRKNIESSLTFSENDLKIVIGLLLLDYPLIIYSVTWFSLFCAEFSTSSSIIHFRYSLDFQISLQFESSLLKLLSLSPLSFTLVFLGFNSFLLFLGSFFFFSLFLLSKESEKIWLKDELYYSLISYYPFSLSPLSEMILMVD